MKNNIFIFIIIFILILSVCFTGCSNRVELQYESPPIDVDVDRRDLLKEVEENKEIKEEEQKIDTDGFNMDKIDTELKRLITNTKIKIKTGMQNISKMIPIIRWKTILKFRDMEMPSDTKKSDTKKSDKTKSDTTKTDETKSNETIPNIKKPILAK